MQNQSIQYFELLKREIVTTLKEAYPGIDDRIEEWKGQTIVFLQEDLLEKVNEHISEKWFYNHMKSIPEKLPRVDMLNLLSRYCGYADWQDFIFRNQDKVPSLPVENDRSNRFFVIIPVMVVSILAVLYLVFELVNTKEYIFTFINADDYSRIISTETSIEILNHGESPRTLYCDSTGTVRIKTGQPDMRFVVRSPYYRTDTIRRILNKFNRNETITLRTNDYALMIHYFSTANVGDWEKRREQLDEMFSDSAKIFEVYKLGTLGMALYDKWEFINRLTIPSASLLNIEVLNTEYVMDKIVVLRFSQGDAKNEN